MIFMVIGPWHWLLITVVRVMDKAIRKSGGSTNYWEPEIFAVRDKEIYPIYCCFVLDELLLFT